MLPYCYPMAIMVLRHEVFEHLGYLSEAFSRRNQRFFYHELGEPIPETGWNGLVVLGGPMSANDPLPGLKDELGVIQKALAAEMPILGICLGSQLIAKALGARVHRNQELEIGWAPVQFTEAGLADPVFQGIHSPETFFHWHGETFDLPAGCEWLAWSDRTRHQAFRHGRKVYGLQFHPEVTPEMIADWSAQPVNCGDVATLAAPIDARAFDQAPLARQIAERWLDLL